MSPGVKEGSRGRSRVEVEISRIERVVERKKSIYEG